MRSPTAKVVLYTTDPCSFCARAKGMFKTRGVDYEEINLTKDPEGRLELVQRTGMMSFPQIFVSGQLVGGFKELLEADEDGRLDELLAASGESPQSGPTAA
jgi:glutaredoxin 3